MKRKITVTVFIKPIFYKNSEIFSNTNLVSEDDLKLATDKMQKITDKAIEKIDKAVEAKTKEIMTV